MPRAPLVRLAALWLTAVLSACSSSPKQSPPASTTTARSVPKILALTGPASPVTCSSPTQVQLHWTTQGAAKVELRIDGGPVFSTYPGGKREPLVPLACDGNTHTYQLTARAGNGAIATESLAIGERGLVT